MDAGTQRTKPSRSAVAADTRRSNLPVQLTSFIGRDADREAVRDAIAGHRLVTLTGAGGCGKTRLALQVASDVFDDFPDGVWWVDLAPHSDAEQVAEVAARVFGVRPLPGMTSLQAVCADLAPRRSLLLLDNCEHLLDSAREFAGAVLEAAPEVSILATSRAPLAVAGEVDWRVPSLSLPEGESLEADRLARESDAASLFVERARSVNVGFALTEENAEAVARICIGLDGIPLAIELAAARARLLSSEQIAAALGDRFRLLTRSAHLALPRHQTLRASVDWSYDLLKDRERVLFRRLAVFVGGFTLEAAERICSDEALAEPEVLDVLGALVETSLVMSEGQGQEIRFRLLESIHHYARERLAESGEWDHLRDRHRDHYLRLAETAAPHLGKQRQGSWYDELDSQATNVDAAFDRAVETSPERALRFCQALFMWWRARRSLSQTDDAYARALAAGLKERAELRARVLWGRAVCALGSGEFEAAETHATEALALAEEAGDSATAGRALTALGLGDGYARPPAGRSQLRRALERSREAGDEWGQAEAAQFLAITHLFQDEHVEVEAALAQVDEITDRIGEGDQLARRALIRGSVSLLDGRLDEAEMVFIEQMPAADADPAVAAWIEAQLSLLEIIRGDPEAGLAGLTRLLGAAMRNGAGMAVPAILTWSGFAEVSLGRFEDARNRLRSTIEIVEGRDSLLVLWDLWLLGESLRMLGDPEASEAAERTWRLGEESGNRLGATRGRLTLARLAAAQGVWSEAEKHALAHLDACVDGDHRIFVPGCLDSLAEIAAGLHSHEESARLSGAAARSREDLGIARWIPEDAHWRSIESSLREQLGHGGYEAAWSAGHDLDLDQAAAWVRRGRGERKRPPGGWEALTPTEEKVVELVAEGLTNPQIAERMFVSRSTVKTHLVHIYGKLDLASRAELAAAAARRLG